MARSLLSIMLILLTSPASAQLVTASETFRIVQVDRDERRLGIADMAADPNVRQNWINLKDSTEVTLQEGQPPVVLSTALTTFKKGDVIRVHGGRTWTGKINAKTIRLVDPSELARPEGAPSSLSDVAAPASGQTGEGITTSSTLSHKQEKWSGKVQEVTPQTVVLETGQGLLLLPRGINYDGNLEVGRQVTALIPAGSGELVSAGNQIVTLRGAKGLYQIPTSQLTNPQATVPVLSSKGSFIELPLQTALNLQAEGSGTVVSREFQETASIVQGSGAGLILNSTPDLTLVATAAGQVFRLPGASGLKIGQPVSFGKGYLNLADSWKPGQSSFKVKGRDLKIKY